MIADSFDARTLANMEVALERACKRLSTTMREQHVARRHIASSIVECAEGGDRTLGGLTKAGDDAALELAPQKAVKVWRTSGNQNQGLRIATLSLVRS
jgi:hypothetical protein